MPPYADIRPEVGRRRWNIGVDARKRRQSRASLEDRCALHVSGDIPGSIVLDDI
jgi:hypothetical protein